MVLAEDVSDRIIGLYALGNRVSADTISAITDRVLPEIKAWKLIICLSLPLLLV